MLEERMKTQTFGKLYHRIRATIGGHYPNTPEGRMAAMVCSTIFEDLAHWKFGGRYLPKRKRGFMSRRVSFRNMRDAAFALNSSGPAWYIEECGVSREWLQRKARDWDLV